MTRSTPDPPVLFVCTGNAARSVMAGAAWEGLGGTGETAGTFVVEGQPMSWRTRQALEDLGVAVPAHRSRQLRDADVASAAVVVGFEVHHVEFVRRRYPEAAWKTASIRRLCRDLPSVEGSLEERLRALRLDEVGLEPWEEVDDPAGGDLDVVSACAAEVVRLVRELHDCISDGVSDVR